MIIINHLPQNYNIHVSVPVISPVIFFKKLPHINDLIFYWSKYRVRNLIASEIKEKYNAIRVRYIPVHVGMSMMTIDDIENLNRNLEFL